MNALDIALESDEDDAPGPINPATIRASRAPGSESRLRAVAIAARHHGVELDVREFRGAAGAVAPQPAELAAWARDQGLVARALRTRWQALQRLVGGPNAGPAVLLLRDGGAALLVGADPARRIVWLRDPLGSETPMAVDELRLRQLWDGEVILIRRGSGTAEEDQPFTLTWLLHLVLRERPLLRDIGLGSVTLSVLTIIPPLLVMTVVDRVVVHRSISTLTLLAVILAITTLYETLLGFARRELVQVVSTRVDAKLNLHVFNRLLGLPLDYFEKNPAGQINYRIAQVWKVRDFLTGKLMGTFLDMFTLVFLLPFLFWLQPTLAWMVLVCAGVITLVIMAFLPPLRRVMHKVTMAESLKGSTMVETVHGIRTVKSLALEPQRRAEWDERTAQAGALRLEAGRLANWPQTIIAPVESFIQRGVLLVGAWIALGDNTGIAIGGLVAFMMLGGRVTQPLVGLARLVEDLEDARASIAQVAMVLNNPTETAAMQGGLRPRLEGGIQFEDLSFTYPGTKTPALDRVSFEIPPGTMLGVVGRSGSGKSTLTQAPAGHQPRLQRLPQARRRGVARDQPHAFAPIFGVVLQDNFLFRGTVRDNITANRPGLTLEDAVRAARLAGAEEFIERLPAGYETWIEEGSSNLSGGQKQRLAIARAVVADPRLLVLDEATSALDPESEALVNANLTRLAKGRTMVIVSHRISSLVDCDLILVMERGRVADIAPHRVLLERCLTYRQLWVQQNRHMDGQGRDGQARASLVPVAGVGH